MNNAWTTVALRASCATSRRQQARSQPLLQLFNGFTRQHRLAHSRRPCEPGCNGSTPQRRSLTVRLPLWQPERSFSAATALCAKKSARQPKTSKVKPPAASRTPSSSSRLRPAPTVAAHTEGVVPAEEHSPKDEESEQLTWRDYDPEGGMPLPGGELKQSEINEIFAGEGESEGPSVEQGNYILSVMHWRRMSGALIDVGLDFPKSSQVTPSQALLALGHLRRLEPGVDESANAQVWAHEETHRLQEAIQQRAVQLGLYKSIPEEGGGDEADEAPPSPFQSRTPGDPQRRPNSRPDTSASALESLRASNLAAKAREDAARAASQARASAATIHSLRGPLELSAGVQPPPPSLELTPSGGIRIARPDPTAWLQPVERKPWVRYFEEQAQIIKSQSVPTLSLLQRLGPGLALLLAVLAACWFLAENYTPPPRAARLWPETAPSVATLWGLTALLGAGFVMGRVPVLWRTYSKFLTLVPAYPYAVSLIGAGVRHDTVLHLASNLVTLWLFGLLLHEDVGRGGFLAIYVASGALGGFASLTVNVLRKNWMAYVFGSSGSVLGVVAAACTLRPNGMMQVMGYEIPISAWVFLALFGAGEAVAAVRGFKTAIDHAGHLGGILGGVAAGVYLRRRIGQGKVEGVQTSMGEDEVNKQESTT